LALDRGDWMEALGFYHQHQFHAPPIDTFELLKIILHKTGVKIDEIRHRFESKVKLTAHLEKRAPEPVEWATFWMALNDGDSRTIATALTGARILGIQNQTGVAEGCAVLIHCLSSEWRTKIVDSTVYGTVTKNNLISVALENNRWDIALEILQHARIGRGEIVNFWPQVNSLSWEVALHFLCRSPKGTLPFDVVIPKLLSRGCPLKLLAEILESVKSLNDVNAVVHLAEHAMNVGDVEFVKRCVEHLSDLGYISSSTLDVFAQLCSRMSPEVVIEKFRAAQLPLHKMSVEILERLAVSVR